MRLAPARPAALHRRTLPRMLVAWMAIFGLYLQLAAAALCLAASSPDVVAGLGAAPICHAQDRGAGDDGSGQPAHVAGACPFCSLHAHAGTLAAPPPPLIVPVVVAVISAKPPRSVLPPLSRRPTDAAPRGPPIVG